MGFQKKISKRKKIDIKKSLAIPFPFSLWNLFFFLGLFSGACARALLGASTALRPNRMLVNLGKLGHRALSPGHRKTTNSRFFFKIKQYK